MVATRGPQVVLEGYARTVARGGAGRTMRDNIAAMDQLVSSGLVADGSSVDGTSRTGARPYDGVVAQFPHEPLSAWEVPAPLLSVDLSASGGPFLPLAGNATVTGPTTFGGAGNGLVATNSASIGGALAVTGNSTIIGSLIVGSGVSGNSTLRVQGVANTTRSLQYATTNLQRWSTGLNATSAESGSNKGANYRIDAYTDTGAAIGAAVEIQRGSGPLNNGPPYIANLAPFRQAVAAATNPNGVIGNLQTLGPTSDRQPVVTLGANPLSVTSGSPTVTVTWTGACVAGGQVQLTNETWVNMAGAAAVGGITPTGWLKAQTIVDNDHFTVTWTSNATSTAVGGGSVVTVQPSFTTACNWMLSGVTTGANFFTVQDSQLFNIAPDFFQPAGSATYPRYEQSWKWVVGPNDTSGTNSWIVAACEWDLTNRGKDMGYSPNITNAVNATIGLWMGPMGGTPPAWSSGGGVGTNWNTVYSVFNSLTACVYDAFSVQPNALVGAANDPTGHGGVGVDIFGSYMTSPSNPFTTTNGTSTITIIAQKQMVALQANGNMVWIPNVYTIAGVTFGNASYAIANVNSAAGTFTITGTGTAAGSVAGGGTGVWFAFANYVPYAPYQMWGSFKHGLISTNARFESGGIIETQPGNGILWNDGTGTASVNSSAPSAGNINVVLTPAGTGAVMIAGASGPTLTSGSGVPASTQPKGSLYTRTGGAVGSTLYVSQGAGTWNPVAGV